MVSECKDVRCCTLHHYSNLRNYFAKKARIMNEEHTLRSYQQAVDKWIQEVGKGYYGVLTNLGILTEEVGELARLLVRQYGEQSSKPGDRDHDLADELADVLWVVTCLANQTGVDLEAAVQRNIEKKTTRDAARHAARGGSGR